ncbi:MAG: GTPase [Thermoleophilia bacterium]
MGRRAEDAVPDAARIIAAAASLREAAAVGADRIPDDVRRQVETAADRADERTSLSALHTVVALAGVTGGGKSSIFNAFAGGDVAETGVRRPITSQTQAAVWGSELAGDLLDWLDVPRRHRVDAAPDDPLSGLVLLDLPDFDSRVTTNRAEADRILERADLFVWVTDPQKYADAVMHDDYVAPRAAASESTVVVLNHMDTVAPDDARAIEQDLLRLLRDDGVANPRVVLTSAITGAGLDELRAIVAEVVGARHAALFRLRGDLRQAAGALDQTVAEIDPTLGQDTRNRLTEALLGAAGVDAVLDAVEADHRRRALGHTGWVFTRWFRHLRADPLRRLRLNRGRPEGTDEARRELEMLVARTSLPEPTPAARAAVDLAVRRVGETGAEGLPHRWADAVRDTAMASADDGLRDALDRAVAAEPLGVRVPIWWRAAGVLQWVFGALVVGGIAWYAVLALLDLLRFDTGDVARFGVVPYPFIMIVAGVILGVVLASVARALAGVGARRRRRRIRRRLSDAVARVGQAHVIAPVEAVIADHARVRELTRAALG